MVAKILSDISEEFVELGKTAQKQITGDQQDTGSDENIGAAQFKHMMGPSKKLTPEQIAEAKKRDEAQKRARIDEINRAIQLARQKREQPNVEEKEEKLIENKKLEEETKAQKKKEELSASITQNIGSHEQEKFVIG